MTSNAHTHHHHDLPIVRATLARLFDEHAPITLLAGGEGRTYRAGDRIYRRETDVIEATYIAELYAALQPQGFRVPQPIATTAGTWVTAEGWSGWTFVVGQPAQPSDVPTALAAIDAFHHAVAHVPYPAYLKQRNTPFDRADIAVWNDLPPDLHPQLAPFVARLAQHCAPLAPVQDQLIHGDLNEENILVAPNIPPAIIDMSPYWRPAPFAVAVFGYWIGPYRGDLAVLRFFEHIPQFTQMLIRAGLRTILINHEFSKLGHALGNVEKEFRTPVDVIMQWIDQQ